jgi:HK97 family phage portal protein
MLFEKFRRKLAINHVEKKSSGYNPFFLNFLTNDFTFAKNALLYLQYYNQVAPVGDAINKISQETAMIQLNPYVYGEKEAEKPLNNSAFSAKFNKPNFRQSGNDFRHEAFIHYLSTGNNYIMVTGVLNEARNEIIQDPVEWYNLRPDFMTIIPDADYFPLFYMYNPQGKQRIFRREMIKTRNGAWEEMYIEDGTYNVLLHWKEPSTNRVFTMLYGDSPLQNVELEIAQYLQASVHNTNLLRNGMSARMLFSFKETPTMSEDQLIKIKNKIETEYSGANNAGKNMFCPIPMDAKNLDINLKDMDFEKLMRRMRVAIYNKLNVPLPMVEGEFTSNSNMKEANLNFYDKAVLPLVAKYNDFQFNFNYLAFYKEEGAFKIGFDSTSIPALQTRIFENVLLMKKSTTVTMNEMREYQGLGSVTNGGNSLFIDANQAPVAGDEDLTDGIGMPARSIAQDSNDKLRDNEKQHLKDILTKHQDSFGKRLYTDEKINSILSN